MNRINRLLLFSLFLLNVLSVTPLVEADVTSGIVGWWKYDETSGTTAADASGSGLTGTLVNGPVWTTGKINGALDFNGSNQYVSGTGPNIANSAFTISAWISADQANGRNFYSLGSTGSTRQAIHLRFLSATSMRFGMYYDDLDATNLTSVTGQWTHIAVTLDSSNVQRIYQNGVLKASRTAGGKYAGNTSQFIGRDGWTSASYFDGKIDDVRVYNRALSAAEVTDVYNSGGFVYSLSNGGNKSVTQGSSVQNTITVTAVSGTPAPVIFAVSNNGQGTGLPAGVTASFSPTTCTPNCSSTLTLTADPTASIGTATVIIAAPLYTGGPSPTTVFDLTVNSVPDTTPPSVPGSLTATAVSDSQIDLAWSASTDNVGVKEYRLERCQGSGCTTFAQFATDSDSPYSDTGLSASTLYLYRINAADGAGNVSGYSNIAEATTQPASTGIVGWWKYDETSGTSAADSSGSGFTGTLVNSPVWTTGKINSALDFNGSNQYVSGTGPNIANSAFTISAWIYADQANGRNFYSLGSTGATRQAIHLRLLSATSMRFGMYYDDLDATNLTSVTGQWTHIAVTLDTSNVQRIYQNGVLKASRTAGGKYAGNTSQFIGRDGWTSASYFDGKIDDVRVYNRALSASEITDVYNSASSVPDLVVTNVSNPPASALLGASFNVTDTTANTGNGSAAASTTSYRLSLDSVITTGDPLLTGTRSVPSLGAGTNSSGSVATTIPSNLTPGTYYLGTCADDGGVVSESNETNNCLASTSTIIVSAPPPVATQLVITSINSGSNLTAGVAFPVVVQSQSAGGTPTNVVSATSVSLSLKTGIGTLGGTLTGTIAAGTNQVTITGLTYTKAESGVVITATRTSGDNLTAGDSAPFTVNPGTANKVVFTTQPGNTTVGSALSGPPTVVVQDSLGNTVTSSTASITVAIATNPSGGTLSGTTTKNAVSGVAIFNDLSINLAGSGYTLGASSTGLTGASSGTFNITSASVSLAAVPTSVPAGDPFTVTWAQIPTPTTRDWIGLYTSGSSDSSYIDYLYVGCTQSPTVSAVSGACSFPISTNMTASTYEFRLFPNDTYNRLATSNAVTIGPPSSLNKVAISVGPTVAAGTPGFSVTVQSQTSLGVPVNVTSNTAIAVNLTLGNGVLGGTLNGTILAGTNQAVIGPVTYSKAESGVVLTASRTSGDDLRAQNSLPFTVIPGPAAQIAFTTQPGNATVGSTIPGPPTVIVQDNAGNAVPSTTANVSIAIGANPGGGVLDNDISLMVGSSVSFPSLSINQLGNGYTLVASSAGLVSATSNPFNITSAAGGGIIAGVITRVSSGATIAGALVDVYQGDTLRGTAVTNSSGNYSISGLATGSYTVRASFTGLVPQVVSNIAVVSGSTTPVDLSLNFGIAVQTPVAGATINDFSVLVNGFFDTSLAPEVGIQVNGYVALIDGNEFATFVPINSQTTTVTATMTDTAGSFLAGDAVPITPLLPTSEPVLKLRPSPAIAYVGQIVNFSLTSLNTISQVQLDGNGDGTIDYTGATLEGVSITFAEPGLYFPTVTVTESGGTVRSAIALMQVLDMNQLDALLTSKWNGMKNALRSGNTVTAVDYIVKSKRSNYQSVFNSLTIPFANIDQILTNITYAGQRGLNIEYEMMRVEGSDLVSYMVMFVLDEDGVWRIKFF